MRVSLAVLFSLGPAVVLGQTTGAAIATIDTSGGLGKAPTFSAALAARLPGVVVTPRSGTAGAGSELWLRGPSSFQYNDPILIIDGVRSIGTQASGLEGTSIVSRLDDIDPATIERIEIFRGIAAAARYGAGAAKGAIVVTTRRAAAGQPRWTAFGESGWVSDVAAYPANHDAPGLAADGVTPVATCPVLAQAAQGCTPTGRRTWNPIREVSPFRTGSTSAGGVRYAHRLQRWHVGASLVRRDVSGVRPVNNTHATTATFDATGRLLPTLTLNTAIAHHRRQVRPDELNGVITGGLVGQAVDDPLARGYDTTRFPPADRVRDQLQTVSRLRATTQVEWQSRSWLTATAILGLEELRQHDRDWRTTASAFRADRTIDDRPDLTSGELSATATFPLWGANAVTTAGYGSRTRGEGLDDFTVFVDLTQMDSSWSRRVISSKATVSGPFIRQRLEWDGRFALAGTARLDRARAVEVRPNIKSYALEGLWRVLPGGADEAASGLSLRAAWGEGGNLIPQVALALAPAQSRPVDLLRPEWASEVEAGVDASAFGGRVSAGLTAYRGRTLAVVELLGPQNVTADAWIKRQGIEATVAADLIRDGRTSWDLEVIGAFHQQTEKGGTGRPEFPPDAAFGSIWLPRYTYEDTNLDGRIAPSEVTVDPDFTDYINLGTPIPSHEIVVRSGHRIGQHLRLTAVIERRGGQRQIDFLARGRCLGFTPRCGEAYDETASLGEQAARAAAVAPGTSTTAGLVQRADFTRLREISLTSKLPDAFARFARLATAQLTVTATNLATWSPYGGLDPEIVGLTGPLSGATQPITRAVNLRLDMAWQR